MVKITTDQVGHVCEAYDIYGKTLMEMFLDSVDENDMDEDDWHPIAAWFAERGITVVGV